MPEDCGGVGALQSCGCRLRGLGFIASLLRSENACRRSTLRRAALHLSRQAGSKRDNAALIDQVDALGVPLPSMGSVDGLPSMAIQRSGAKLKRSKCLQNFRRPPLVVGHVFYGRHAMVVTTGGYSGW